MAEPYVYNHSDREKLHGQIVRDMLFHAEKHDKKEFADELQRLVFDFDPTRMIDASSKKRKHDTVVKERFQMVDKDTQTDMISDAAMAKVGEVIAIKTEPNDDESMHAELHQHHTQRQIIDQDTQTVGMEDVAFSSRNVNELEDDASSSEGNNESIDGAAPSEDDEAIDQVQHDIQAMTIDENELRPWEHRYLILHERWGGNRRSWRCLDDVRSDRKVPLGVVKLLASNGTLGAVIAKVSYENSYNFAVARYLPEIKETKLYLANPELTFSAPNQVRIVEGKFKMINWRTLSDRSPVFLGPFSHGDVDEIQRLILDMGTGTWQWPVRVAFPQDDSTA